MRRPMAIQRLTLDIVDEVDFELIAIHCAMESYRMAFALNKYLGFRFSRKKKDICSIAQNELNYFACYGFYDVKCYTNYTLIKNKYQGYADSSVKKMALFDSLDSSVTRHLLPELKNVDYFVKITTDTPRYDTHKIVSRISTIKYISTAYLVDNIKLKSKNNLIFE